MQRAGALYCADHTPDGSLASPDDAERTLSGLATASLVPSSGPLASSGDLRARTPGLFTGNNNDLIALAAVVIGGTTLVSCCGGFYCLPVVALLAGLAGLLGAKDALDPSRAKTLSLVAMGGGGALLALAACFVVGYLALIIAPWMLSAR